LLADDFADDPLATALAGTPDKVAVIELATGQRLTYRQLDALVARTAGWLADRLPAAGERIAYLGRNSVPMLVTALAAERAGAIFVPLNWRLAAPEITALAADCAPALKLADAEFSAALPGAMLPSELLVEIGRHAPASPRPLDPHRTVILLYTSGTTGTPKGVIVTVINAGAGAANFAAVGRVDSSSVMLSDLPMFHTIGLIAVARTALTQGGTVVLVDRFLPARTLNSLANPALGVTHYFAVPTMIEAMEREPGFTPAALSRLRAIFVGGSLVAPSLIARLLEQGIRLVNGYGMSEANTVIHVPIDEDSVRKSAGAVGLPAPNMEVRLVAEGRDVDAGDVGEVWLRGPAVTPGYWNRPEETSAAFSDGWYRTGDLARRDPTGFYRIVDRLKDMYVSGGENVYPAEVEAVLHAHPAVADAAVLEVPDPRWGESGLALVVPRAGAAFDPAALAAHCVANLAKFKCPVRFVRVDAIPRSAAGKILKPALRERLNAGEFA
jgi:fatty-acyl-CoA synthase